MRAILAITGVEVTRLLRDRSNIFFVFVFPLLLVLLIGVQFGGSFAPHLAVHVPDGTGELADDLLARLEAADVFEIDRVASADEVGDRVARGAAVVGLTVPADYDRALRAGGTVEVGVVARPDGTGQTLATTVRAIVGQQAALLKAARVVADRSAVDVQVALDRVESVDALLPGVSVETRRTGDSTFAEFQNLGQFDLGASSQLLLFVFLTSLTGSASLIQTRQWGLATRMLSTPTTAGQVLLGQALGRFAVALVQALYIILGTLVIFGVNWGDPLGVLAIVVLFSAVSSGAAMLMGSLFSNDAQAGGIGVFLGLALAALGGSMAPIEVFPPRMQTVAHWVTPHAWANDAFAELVRRDGGVGDILPELGVLAAVAVVLLTLASWRLHRVTVRG